MGSHLNTSKESFIRLSDPEGMAADKPLASLSCDLDDKWSYMKTHGDRAWDSFPSYLDVVVPRVLECFNRRNLRGTFFIVGQDAARETNHPTLRAIADAGHEIGNHSFRHDPWLHLYSEQEIAAEMTNAEDHIERATGQKPVGFRGPGFSLSHSILRELVQRGYLYDATTFPTFLVPLVRLYYFATASFTAEQRRQRRSLGGKLREGFRSIKPYRWRMNGGTLLEIPVTTLPGLKFPMHVSYLLGLSLLSERLALRYFEIALKCCRYTGTQPSLVLHPTDFLGSEDQQGLSFIPGMALPRAQKLQFVNELLSRLDGAFSVLTLRQHAEHVAQSRTLPVREPSF